MRQRVLTYSVVVMVVVNILALAFLAAWVLNTRKAQVCAQHDITVAIRQIGRELGLPARIVVPDIEGIDCP